MIRSLIISFLFVFILFPYFADAQVSGRVFGDDSDTPITNANIIIQPINIGTVSDAKGEYNFEVIAPGNYQLTVSFVGYKSDTLDFSVFEGEPVHLEIILQADNIELGEVFVLGNFKHLDLIEHSQSEPLSLLPAVTKVSKVEIEKQGALTLIEAIKYIPGGWTETRGRKVKQFFSIRGQKYPYPSYSINGIWQKEFDEMPYLINSSLIEEIKIVRSSSALLKSLSALTGVIDVKTRQVEKNEIDLSLKYGSLNTFQTGVSYGNKYEKISYKIGVNGFGTSGPEGRNGKESIWNLNGFLQWDINSKLNLSAHIFYVDGMRELVQPIEPADAKFLNRIESYAPIQTLLTSAKLQYIASDKFSSELHLNLGDRKPEYHNTNLSTGILTEYKETDYEITINQINALVLSRDNTIRFGALYNYWQAPEGKRFYYGRKAEVHTVSGVITDQHYFGNLLLDAGFRLTKEYYSEWGGFSIEGSGSKFSEVEPIVDQWQSPVWQATSGLSYSLPANSSLHINFAGGIVNPRKGSLNENGETPDNETRINYDLGYVNNFSGSGKISVTTFFVNRRSAIDYSGGTVEIGDSEIMELYENTDKRNFGVELEFKSPFVAKYFSFVSNITFMKGETDIEGEWKKDDEMPNIVANVRAYFQKERLDVNVYLNYIGAYKNDRFVNKIYIAEFGKAPLGDFTTFDLTTGYRFGKNRNMRLFVEGKNIFDVEFQTVPGYPDMGRMLFAGMNITL